MTTRGRIAIFAAVVVIAGAVGAATLIRALDEQVSATSPPATRTEGLPTEPFLAFRSMARDANYGRMVTVPLDEPTSTPTVTDLECSVLDVGPAGGICLTSDFSLVAPYTAVVFDESLRPVEEIRLEGGPSRTRLSPDGRLAATTVFVTGHSYAVAGFSTATTIIDIATGQMVANLEEFAVTRDGAAFSNVDFNFWGVTFVGDGRSFFATLGTGGATHLVKGDLQTKTLVTMRDNVECPSLSPDGTRVAYKKRVGTGQPVRWRLHVLDLATGEDTPLAETANVDDQVEWLDDKRVIYGAPTDDPASPAVYVVPADGSGAPVVLRAGAASPAVVAG